MFRSVVVASSANSRRTASASASSPGRRSLADVAKAHNKTANDVQTALKNEAHKRIDAAVTAGKLTADQANTQKSQVDTRIDQFVTQVTPQQGPNGAPGAAVELPD